jgi:hypothetical protein
MTWPRYVPSESYCFVTRRCTQRKFLLKPSKAANRAFEYCRAWASQKTGVQVLFSVVLSNHVHLGPAGLGFAWDSAPVYGPSQTPSPALSVKVFPPSDRSSSG